MEVAGIPLNLQLCIVIAAIIFNVIVYNFIDVVAVLVLLTCIVWGLYVIQCACAEAELLPTRGRSVLITGCDAGIGYHLAVRADSAGFRVYAGCLKPDCQGAKDLEKASQGRIRVLRLDVTSDDDVSEQTSLLREECGEAGLWAVVNNAGLNGFGPLELCSMNFFKAVGDVNLFGAIRVTRAVLPLLRKAKGRIVNVSSERGVTFRGNSSVYCVAKAGLEAFSDCMRVELMTSGVKVVVVQPGHFGGATAILQEAALGALEKQLLEGLKEAEKVPENTHTRSDVDDIMEATKNAAMTSYPIIDPVIDALMTSLRSAQPYTRYYVSGGNSLIDRQMVYAKLKPILPDTWMDRVLGSYVNG